MKKNNIKIYAKALAEIILKKITPAEEKKITDNFLKLLVKNGKENKGVQIIALTRELLLKQGGNKKIILETARKMTQSQKDLLKSVAKEGDVVQEKINPELIAGIKIIINNERQFDASMLRKIQQTFK